MKNLFFAVWLMSQLAFAEDPLLAAWKRIEVKIDESFTASGTPFVAYESALDQELAALVPLEQVHLLEQIINGQRQGFKLSTRMYERLTMANMYADFFSRIYASVIRRLASRMTTVEGVAAMATGLKLTNEDRLNDCDMGRDTPFILVVRKHLMDVKDKNLLYAGLCRAKLSLLVEYNDSSAIHNIDHFARIQKLPQPRAEKGIVGMPWYHRTPLLGGFCRFMITLGDVF